MISKEKISFLLNEKLRTLHLYENVYIPYYESKIKKNIISFVRFFFKNKAFFYFQGMKTNISTIDFWKWIEPDKWIKSSNKMVTSVEDFIDASSLWKIEYYEDFRTHDLSFGVKPSSMIFNVPGGFPIVYVDKKDGTIYKINDIDTFTILSEKHFAVDYDLYKRGEKYKINWQECIWD